MSLPQVPAKPASVSRGRWMTHDSAPQGGWYPRRRGLLEHLRERTISLLDLAVHDFLCMIADHKTGLASCSGEKIFILAGRDADARSIRRSLERLEKIGWIKRWAVKGKKGNYPVLIARFAVKRPGLVHENAMMEKSVPAMIWWRVNIERTIDWRHIEYDPCHDETTHVLPQFGQDLSTVQEVEKRETSKPTSAPSARNSAARAARLDREQLVHVETHVGSGPEIPAPSFCAVCALTKSWHARSMDKKIRDEPNYDGHEFVAE